MGRIRLFGLTLLAAFAFSVIVVESASAVEPGLLFLSGESAPVGMTGSTSTATLKEKATGKTITCNSSKFSSTSANEAHITLFKDVEITFLGCKEGGKLACNTEGAAKEELKVLVDAHFVALLEGIFLQPGIVLLVLNSKLEDLPIDIKCGVAIVEVRGAVFGLLKPGTEVGGGDVKVGTLELTTKLKCDSSDELCRKLEVENPFESNFTGKFGASEVTASPELTFSKMVLIDS